MTDPKDNAFAATDVSEGLSKREHFAAMAMQGLCANSIPGRHHQHDFLATEAVGIADALIEALNKTPQQ